MLLPVDIIVVGVADVVVAVVGDNMLVVVARGCSYVTGGRGGLGGGLQQRQRLRRDGVARKEDKTWNMPLLGMPLNSHFQVALSF